MNRQEHLLTILAEECAEVAKRCSKALRFGLDEVQPGHDESNRVRISREFGDLIAAFEMLGFPVPSREAVVDKKAKVEHFLKYSAEIGTLNLGGTVGEQKVEPCKRFVKSGEPCDHPGCLSHATHRCEGCGRYQGIGDYDPETKPWYLPGSEFRKSQTCKTCGEWMSPVGEDMVCTNVNCEAWRRRAIEEEKQRVGNLLKEQADAWKAEHCGPVRDCSTESGC